MRPQNMSYMGLGLPRVNATPPLPPHSRHAMALALHGRQFTVSSRVAISWPAAVLVTATYSSSSSRLY